MTDEESFIASILADPDNDTPRLAYADWLDENAGEMKCNQCHGYGVVWDSVDGNGIPLPQPGNLSCRPCSGSGHVSDGRKEQAEFIRVQCELAELTKFWLDDQLNCLDMYLDPQDNEQQTWKHKVNSLRSRERELWKSDCIGMMLPRKLTARLTLWLSPDTIAVYPYAVVRRGFVESVRLAAVVGQWPLAGYSVSLTIICEKILCILLAISFPCLKVVKPI